MFDRKSLVVVLDSVYPLRIESYFTTWQILPGGAHKQLYIFFNRFKPPWVFDSRHILVLLWRQCQCNIERLVLNRHYTTSTSLGLTFSLIKVSSIQTITGKENDVKKRTSLKSKKIWNRLSCRKKSDFRCLNFELLTHFGELPRKSESRFPHWPGFHAKAGEN